MVQSDRMCLQMVLTGLKWSQKPKIVRYGSKVVRSGWKCFQIDGNVEIGPKLQYGVLAVQIGHAIKMYKK